MSFRDKALTLPERVARVEERMREASRAIVAIVPTTLHSSLAGLSSDDHPQYQLRSAKGQGLGYAGLDATGVVPKAQLPADVVYAGSLPDVTDLELLVWLNMGAP